MRIKVISVILSALVLVSVFFFVFRDRAKKESDILVMCGGSTRLLMEEIISNYSKVSDNKVLLTVGGSGELCSQIKYTRKGDIYMCHDPFMPWAEKQGLIDRWRTVAYLEPVILVKKGNPKGVKEFKDLAQPGMRLGVGDPFYSTCGVIINHMVGKMDYESRFHGNIKVTNKNHHKLATDLKLGSLDAVIVWNAIAHDYRDKLDIIPVNKNLYADAITSATYGVTDVKNIKITIGIIAYARDRKNVRKFWEYATTTSRSVFKEYGFRPIGE